MLLSPPTAWCWSISTPRGAGLVMLCNRYSMQSKSNLAIRLMSCALMWTNTRAWDLCNTFALCPCQHLCSSVGAVCCGAVVVWFSSKRWWILFAVSIGWRSIKTPFASSSPPSRSLRRGTLPACSQLLLRTFVPRCRSRMLRQAGQRLPAL